MVMPTVIVAWRRVVIVVSASSWQATRPKGDHLVILSSETWMDLRRIKPLREAGATYKEIAAELGVDWRTVLNYLATDACTGPAA